MMWRAGEARRNFIFSHSAAAPGLAAQLCNDWRVIRWPLQPAWSEVDRATRTSGRKFARQQDMVDAKAQVAAESIHSVVPPGKRLFRLVEQAKAVREAETEKPSERRALRLAAQHLARPGLRIMHIPVLRGDVVIARHDEPGIARKFLPQQAFERGEPFQFVYVLLRSDRLAVRHIGADDACALERGRHDSLLGIIKTGNARLDLRERGS